jgi:delta24-sterol reductase
MLAELFVIGLVLVVVLYFTRHKLLSLITWIMMTKYRFIFVILVVLPLSTIYDLFFYMKNKYIFYTRKAIQDHDKLVHYVQEQVKAYNECGSNKPMCTARSTQETMSLRISKHKENLHKIDISALHNILQIDEQNGIVRVEPLVTCGQLTATLNPLGWTIPVVPELDDLTIGGLVSGFGVETSSHRVSNLMISHTIYSTDYSKHNVLLMKL